MKVLLNLTNDTLEYQDTKVFIQGTDARNQIIVYADEDITFTNLTIAYQLQNGRTTIAMANSGLVESDSDDYLEGYTGYIFNVPLSVTTLTGNIMATVVANISGAKHKFNILNTVIDSVFFEAYETALEEAESEFATDIEAMQSAIVQLQQEQALGVLHPSDIVDNDESDDSTKILSARMGKVLAERIGAATSGLVGASYNTETGILTLTYENDDTFTMKVGLDTEDIESMASDILADVNDDLDDYKTEVNQSLDDMIETVQGLGQLQPSGTATSSVILAKTSADGIWIGTDTGDWYYWNGTQYVSGGVYQTDLSYEDVKNKQISILNNSYALLNNVKTFDDYYINATNGNIMSGSSFFYTDYVSLDGFNVVDLLMVTVSESQYNYNGLAFYDENKVFLKGVKANVVDVAGEEQRKILIPNGAKYLRVGCRKTYELDFYIKLFNSNLYNNINVFSNCLLSDGVISSNFQQGNILNGSNIDATNRIRTIDFLSDDIVSITTDENHQYTVHAYLNDSWVGMLNINNEITPNLSSDTYWRNDVVNFYTLKDLFNVDYKYKLTYRKIDNTDITPTEKQYISSVKTKINEYASNSFKTIMISASDSDEHGKSISNFVCDGTNDEVEINNAIQYLATNGGGKIVLNNGHYHIDSLTEYTGYETRKYGLYFPDTRAEITIEGISHIHKYTNTSFQLNELGAIIEMSESCYNSIGENDKVSLVGAHPNWIYSHKFGNFKNLCFRLPSNEKNIVCLDMKWFSEASCEGIFVTTNADLTSDTNVNPKCIGVRSCGGGNNGYYYFIKHCKILGVGTAFHIAGEHLIMEQCSAQRCGYGFAFGNVSFLENWNGNHNVGIHNISIRNVCFEYTWGGMIFGGDSGRNAITIEDLNCEEGPGTNGVWATQFICKEEVVNNFVGNVSYYLISTTTWTVSNRSLWESGSGINWDTNNMMAKRQGTTSERPSYPELRQKYYDTTIDKYIMWNGSNWIELN